MWTHRLAGVGELLVPKACAGCGAPGAVLCRPCREHLRQPPHPVYRDRELGMPVFALGPYSDIRRSIIIAMKEYNNRRVRPYVGAVLAAGVDYLRAAGQLPHAFDFVPAPTRVRSARARGGDPVADFCRAACAHLSPDIGCCQCVRISARAPDQARLNAGERWANIRDAITVYNPQALGQRPLVIVDDVVTTGATLAATADRLRGHGGDVAGAITFADA